MSKPDQTKGEKKSPAAKGKNLTAQHFAIGDTITTKSGIPPMLCDRLTDLGRLEDRR